MCGIAGVIYRDPLREPDRTVLRSMGAAISHRGPDAEGYFVAQGVGLVHRRLSIIDLDSGDQPLGNEDGSIQVVFNGEIYNYRRLRPELEAKGHRFKTRSDTEVLVHLYEEVGEQLVDQLRGMFAFALWDARSQRLMLARDRVGLKPLYWYCDPDKLVFASELKGILAHGDLGLTLDEAALDAYLALGFIPAEKSIFAQIRKLPPGHLVCVKREQFEHAVPRRYWSYRPAVDGQRSVEDWLEAIDAKLTETVQAHLVADVPVGAFLSGGLDSSAMVQTYASLVQGKIRTFSIGFLEEQFSELPFARQIASHFHTDHHEQIVTPQASEILQDLIHFYDEPFADSSAVPSLYLARLAREYVKVVISGDGGDEAFGGYTRYAHDLREAWLRRQLPRWLRLSVLRPLSRCWPKADWLPRILRAKTALTNLSLDPKLAYANTVALCRLPLRRRLLRPEIVARLQDNRPEDYVTGHYDESQPADPLAAMICADVHLLLPDDFLTKVDRASMSCGLEVRPPLVDHELLELAARVPSNLKLRDGETKWIFKRLFRGRLPQEVSQRPKQGFEIPIDLWLRGPLQEVFESAVLRRGAPVADWIDQDVVRRLYSAHRRRIGHHGNLLWALLIFALWCERYLRQ